MQHQSPPPKVHGIAHFFAAARYSCAGAKRLWGETAFRHELIGLVAIFALFFICQVALYFYVFAAIIGLVTFAVEALNTAIEDISDKLSPEWSTHVKHAKDLGSFSVVCLLFANGVFAAFAVLFTLYGLPS